MSLWRGTTAQRQSPSSQAIAGPSKGSTQPRASGRTDPSKCSLTCSHAASHGAAWPNLPRGSAGDPL
ncbi:hypothetical protein NDU88_004996 [Pleurodeles waltl]|uniref:Uncharacterized protein n=1 Tax=Pleurodeles waltl TaxID=8319 RepID=A0AAV7TVZ9_PLEWA|nr:hypothetical protein NDU88_004996 [Pleurodeles waltl]